MTAIVLQVGCPDCGEGTTVVGPIHPDIGTAKNSVPQLCRGDWSAPSSRYWGGEAMYVVVDLSAPCVTAVALWRSPVDDQQVGFR